MSFDDLKAVATAGKLGEDDLVWKEGTADWVPARTVTDLLPQPATPPVPPPKPAAPPVPPPVRPRAAASRLPIHDSPITAKGPPPTAKELGDLVKEFLRRATNPNPGTIAPSAEEEQRLVQAGYDPVAQKFAVWRRAVLWVSVVPTAFAALFGAINVISMDKDGFSGFGSTLFFVLALISLCSAHHRCARRARLRQTCKVSPACAIRWARWPSGCHC